MRADRRPMRRAPSITALLLALVAVGVLGTLIALDLRRAVPDRAPRAAIDAATNQRAEARDAAFRAQDRSYDTPWDPRMVRDRVVWRAEAGAPPTTDAAIVNATPGADLEATARECAAEIGADTSRVQCYVFASSEAYAFKNITGELELDEPTAIVNLCWAVMASTTRAAGAVTISDMRLAPQTWSAQGCPASWMGGDA